MLEQNGRLKDLLDYFTFMHDKPAHALIAAVLPLIRFSRDLQVQLIKNLGIGQVWCVSCEAYKVIDNSSEGIFFFLPAFT